MKKSSILVLLLCIVALGCVYADNASIKVQVSPYSLQTINATGGKYISKYGYGANLGFRYKVWNNLTAGLDISLSIYDYAELSDLDADYSVTGFRAVAGYSYEFVPKFYGEAELSFGVDIREIAEQSMGTFGLDLYLGAGYRINDEFAVTAGAAGGIGFQVGKKAKSTDFCVKTRVGLQAEL